MRSALADRTSGKAGRPLLWATGLSLSLVLVAALVVRLVLDDDPYVATPSAGPAARVEPGAAAAALHDLETAVAARDAAAARALAPPDDEAAATLLAAVVGNARALRVEDFSLRYVDEEGAVAPDGSWSAAVDATWRFAGFDRAPARAEVTVRFVADGDRVAVDGFGGGDRRDPLWLHEPLRVLRSPGSLVMVAGPSRRAEQYAARARAAVPVVRRVLPGWRSGLVVEVPATARDLDAALAADPGEYANIAAVTATVDGSLTPSSPVHVFVNPEVFGDLRPQGAQVVMSHEAVHVATDAATSGMPLWLLEGFADYVALRDVALPLSTTAGQITRQVRREGAPSRLPDAAEFDTTTTHLGASYEGAWLACRLLARTGGEAALVRFYEQVDAGTGLGPALRSTFGLSVAELTTRWRRLLTDLAS
ncbi:hypothetical protein ACT8ZV_19125 [Nocardioides sp. MAHUQ-72]|uniref:hypothetical protein n=1 Tax=unclassified Nocardioides TaxID=2615069 RepID=UPI00360F2555